jgi:predicted Fe-Mo cluster-binding NifX family protein
MLAQLQGCDTVLAAGMGPRLVRDLEANGFKVVITNELNAAKAVEMLVKGQLVPQPSRCRCCGH